MPRLFISDGTEFSFGWKATGIVIRYRGNIRGVMLLTRNHELSWFHYRTSKLSWSHIVRIPGKRRAIKW